MDINNPNYHRVHEECEKQKKAFEELMGGRRAMMGNAWDPWNQMGISWCIYNDFKNKGYSDEKIAKDHYRVEIRECHDEDIVEIDTFNELKAIDKSQWFFYIIIKQQTKR